jgi:hypothetical protein
MVDMGYDAKITDVFHLGAKIGNFSLCSPKL